MGAWLVNTMRRVLASARVLQGPHRGKVIRVRRMFVRRCASDGSSLSNVSMTTDTPQDHAATAHEQVVGHQSETVGRTRGGRPAYLGRSRGAPTNKTYLHGRSPDYPSTSARAEANSKAWAFSGWRPNVST